ncbi:MAG: glycine cleavage system aminomethyltransferase GcvT [Candidatus Nanopelagicales bacterium]|nr:glycine cleavage system aminomethyltransferase GcvT [Candidatus Nanopelagicales bacterium]MCF8539079.1 glycine cleavage system aminomethyltransferase GcvT [Candidatus Nanopelagicales bacterium]MCF8550855.1 glycine cleavage system aminomethyltransferase GcvT [Candidatus Nanopelagicales bacterium]
MATDLQRTPLFSAHQEKGAKMADFGGWEMPIEYSGAVAEHQAVRSSVGLFDVSHMGKLRVTGPGAVAALNAIVTSELGKITAGQAQYSMLLNDSGGVTDDFIVYRESDDSVFIIPNATNADTVAAALASALPGNITLENLHTDLGIVAVQGPRSAEVLNSVGLPTDLDYMSFTSSEFRDNPVTVCRTGYTGEVGYEIVAPSGVLPALWEALMEATTALGGAPAGLGARDILRTEMGYPLHGQDISPEISPVEALLAWSVGWAKPEFHGKAALLDMRESGAPRKRVALRVVGRGIPRAHMGVYTDPELTHRVGEVTSGTYSPLLKQGIALALVESSALDSEPSGFYVDARGKALDCERTALPFVDASPK